MSTFNLSLVASMAPKSDVQASDKLQTVIDPKTDKPEEQTITKDGITIDKNLAPKLVLDAPIGHMYTELLNKELSIESMGAIVAAAADDNTSDPQYTGNVVVGPQGSAVETTADTAGYIYIVDADTLESRALGDISSKFLDRRTKDPSSKLGIAMISQGRPTATVESLTKVLKACNVSVTYTKEGLIDMASKMLGQ